MAELSVSGRMVVKTLKKQFKEAFGCSLRVYAATSCKGRFADEDATLASIRGEGAKGGEMKVNGNTLVGNFEKKFAETYGIGVQVANANDTALAKDDVTISAAGKA